MSWCDLAAEIIRLENQIHNLGDYIADKDRRLFSEVVDIYEDKKQSLVKPRYTA